ncbi:mandelate racemase/muconate lactonizing enzyme family protein [Sediminispirochaeta bajacaliforniensis]|uniref:mandelate racemase/muconate lactonizing enzyme family protein n=1 Tax=Sediminispirochaeta bajacaliforniensis TaxID=148 RepID=UPI00037F77F4|nr:dipeptide epimerase [Sediminispirochaeta bajacaliforniensis]
MKILRCEVWPVTLKLRAPFTIAYSTLDETVNVFFRIVTDTGLTGCGVAAPDEMVTGENETTILPALRETAEPLLRGSDPLKMGMLIEKLGKALPKEPTARAAVDMALFDLLGKKAHLPLFQLLGACRSSIKTSVTVGIMPLEETLEETRRWIAKGFSAIKLKGGLNLEEDIRKVRRLRELLGPGVGLRFDANQGYSVEEAQRFIEETASAKLEAIEQPTPAASPALLGDVRAGGRGVVPVMADESLLKLSDAFHLARKKLVDMLNIKLMKTGGIRPAERIAAIARAAGQEIMVGCMDEAGLGVAAGLHFALAQPDVRYADLDGCFDFTNDTTAAAVRVKNGLLSPTGEPGLGFEVSM